MTNIKNISVTDELSNDYVSYAVITANRAISSSIDGLKLSHRRIIQTCLENNYTSWVKTARIAGSVMGTLHPHGDSSSVIQNLANVSDYLAPLMELQGNGGGFSTTSRQKISGDSAASGRYTESKLSEFGRVVFDIPIKYLKTGPNYDNKQQEVKQYVPVLPLALINAQSGIGTGYATNTCGFPVANILKAIKVIDDPNKVPGKLGTPDFPFNTNIIKTEGLVDLHLNGKGSIDLQGAWTIDKKYDTGLKRNRIREALIITKITTGNAEQFLEQVKKAYEDGKIEGIANITDETSKDIRVIIVCKNNVKAESLLPALLKYTGLASKYSAKFTVIDKNNALPAEMTPTNILLSWHEARVNTLLRMYSSQLADNKAVLEVKVGLLSLLSKIKEIAILIMNSESEEEAAKNIIKKYKTTAAVAEAILSIQLKRLTKLNRKRLEIEINELKDVVNRLAVLTTDKQALRDDIYNSAKKAAKLCSDRISEIVTATVQADVTPMSSKTNSAAPADGISTRKLNKATKMYFNTKDKSYKYCGSINEVRQALVDGRHPLEDVLIADVVKKSVVSLAKVKGRRRTHSPAIKASVVKREMKKGRLSSEILKAHLKEWKKK